MKICVYAICKNEEKHIERFCESASNADLILIADTGSTDNTVDIAKTYSNTKVYNISVDPWRFDTARNIALGLVPEDMDICITLDLDEVLVPGWREEIEKSCISFKSGETNILQHLFENGNKSDPYHVSKVSSRFGWIWRGICHEMRQTDPRINRRWAFSDKILMRHLPDTTKSRYMYLDLIKANVSEFPHWFYSLYYHVRQLYNCKKYEECIIEANKLIEICPSDISERNNEFSKFQLNYVYLMRGSCYILLGEENKAIESYKIACDMNLHIRQPLMMLSLLYYQRKEYTLCYEYCMKALEIQKRAIYKHEKQWLWEDIPLRIATICLSRIS